MENLMTILAAFAGVILLVICFGAMVALLGDLNDRRRM